MEMESHKVVSQEEWLEASRELLKKEKEFTRVRDEMNAERRKLPWVKVTANYLFDSTEGRKTLGDLFGKNSQLIVYHFMFVPGWKEGCPGCSFLSDHVDGALPHLVHHDVSFVAISLAPLEEFLPYKKRMGWTFPWVSSAGCDFNRDYQATFTQEGIESGYDMYNFQKGAIKKPLEAHGISVFFKDERSDIFRTYSSYARGGDLLLGTYNWLDLTPKGRNEEGNMAGWMKRHDQYG
jgi:predicted dithiol-disulfide oxidoreductase (DUF899 family)